MTRWSVRTRVTVAAVVVTAVVLAVAGWGLVTMVEHTQLGRIAATNQDRVDEIVEQLEAGVPPEDVALLAAATPFGILQVIDNARGDVLTGSPGPAWTEPILVLAPVAGTGPMPATRVLATEPAGGGEVEEVPGPGGQAVALQVRYEQVDAGGRDLTVVAASPLDAVTRSLDAVRRGLWVGVPAMVVLSGAMAWWVIGRALRPVDAMRSEVESISSSTLHRRVPEPDAGDEVARLARTMNMMLDRLESASERQRRFVSDASHELRSPVAALRTELEVASSSSDPSVLQAAIAGALAEEGRLEVLLSDLLELASVDEATPLPLSHVDLVDLAREEARRTRRVPVVVDVNRSAMVRGSASQLRRVVVNLVDNAARHAATSVLITVDGGRLIVEDDGPGIPPAERGRVFERFCRLDEGRARDHGGAGLGLALVRAITAAHGGRAWAESAPTGGARLVVDLPEAAPSIGTGNTDGARPADVASRTR